MRSIAFRHIPAANDSPSADDAKLRQLVHDLEGARAELAAMFPSETLRAGEELARLEAEEEAVEATREAVRGSLEDEDDLDPAGPSRAILAILDRIAADLAGVKRGLDGHDDDEEA